MKQSIYSWRTQISLSPQLRKIIDTQRILSGESLSKYLRKAAVLRLALEEVEKKKLELIAETVVGKAPKARGGWKKVKSAVVWQRKERRNEASHRS